MRPQKHLQRGSFKLGKKQEWTGWVLQIRDHCDLTKHDHNNDPQLFFSTHSFTQIFSLERDMGILLIQKGQGHCDTTLICEKTFLAIIQHHNSE